MNIRLVLFPDYVTIQSTFDFSPRLGTLLVQMDVGVYVEYYEGKVNTIPQTNGVPTFVRASTKMKCSEDELARACEDLGFLCFYDDQLVTVFGRQNTEKLLQVTREYLAKYDQLVAVK